MAFFTMNMYAHKQYWNKKRFQLIFHAVSSRTHCFANGSSFTVFQMEQLHTAERSQCTASHAIRVPLITFDEPDPNLPFFIPNLKFKIPDQVKGDSPDQTLLSLAHIGGQFQGKKNITIQSFGLFLLRSSTATYK